jgi:F420-dependent oxidoreductase-like protein
MTAMTATTLDQLSNGRFLLGLGVSGPQVVEGWHGVPFGKPLARTREYVAIIRQVLERKGPLEHHGAHYDIPYTGPGSTGLAKPLRSIIHGDPDLKIYTASVSPAGLRVSGEVADGVLPFFMSPEKAAAIVDPIVEGRARAGKSRDLADFDNAPYVRVSMGEDVEKCRDALRPGLALYIGGMGARSANFYNDLARRMGYEAEAAEIQDLFLAGKRQEAAAAVPDALIDETSLVGPPERIRDRLQAWRDMADRNWVGSLLLTGADTAAMRVIAEAAL